MTRRRPSAARPARRIHVFAIDWVPAQDEIASGGGLRGRQLIEALRGAGCHVTVSVPANCRHVRRLGRNSPALRSVLLHTPDNQLDIIGETRPDAVLWGPPLIRTIPFTGAGDMVQVCDLIGLPHIEAAMGAPGLVRPIRERLVQLCRGADLVLTGSEEQHGYWIAELSRDAAPPPTAIVPYALPPDMHAPGAAGTARLARLHMTGMVYAWSTSVPLLQRVAAWVAGRRDVRLSLIAGTDPGGATDRAVLQALGAIAAQPNVDSPGERPFAQAMQDYRAGSVALDLYEPNLERRMAVPIRTVNALTHGVPVLTTIESPMTRRLATAAAALIVDDRAGPTLEAALDRLAAMPARALGRMASAAREFAAGAYDPAQAAATLLAALDAAFDRRAARRASWLRRAPEQAPHVLVVTDVEANLRELRIDIPFGGLLARGLISGYTIWSRGQFAFSTSRQPSRATFHVIWVQRSIPPEAAFALASLDLPFVFDLDDNLLESPAYRERFPVVLQQTVRNLLAGCTVLSCSTARLAQLLQGPALTSLAGKTVVTPAVLREMPPPRTPGAPRAVLWASSDAPALTRSRLPVLKAIRDFCLAQNLRLVCIGAPPPDLLLESDVRIEHIGSVPYGSYLSLLRSWAPAMIVCPLETDADEATRAFVDSKSDIKILEALSAGLVGVFSRSPAYTDSDLPAPILCDNTYADWMAALQRAAQHCAEPDSAPPPAEHRCAAASGLLPWFDALDGAALPEPLAAARFTDAVCLLRSRYGRRLLSEAEFDEAFYLRKYPDVQDGIEAGQVASAYAHYLNDGFPEARLGHAADTAAPHNEQVWANLLHTIGDLRNTVEQRAQQIETLRARRATRIRLRQAGH